MITFHLHRIAAGGPDVLQTIHQLQLEWCWSPQCACLATIKALSHRDEAGGIPARSAMGNASLDRDCAVVITILVLWTIKPCSHFLFRQRKGPVSASITQQPVDGRVARSFICIHLPRK